MQTIYFPLKFRIHCKGAYNHVIIFAFSGSSDSTAILWEWKIGSNLVKKVNVYKGHERNIESLSVSPKKDIFASGGWDHLLKIWSTDSSESDTLDGESTAKRSKTNKYNVKVK